MRMPHPSQRYSAADNSLVKPGAGQVRVHPPANRTAPQPLLAPAKYLAGYLTNAASY